MGFSTFIEINHDEAYKIAKEPMRVGQLLEQYTRACSDTVADALRQNYGITVWHSASRSGWENEARSALSPEYREAMERIKAKS